MIPKECKRLAEVGFPIAKALKRVVQDLPAALQKERAVQAWIPPTWPTYGWKHWRNLQRTYRSAKKNNH